MICCLHLEAGRHQIAGHAISEASIAATQHNRCRVAIFITAVNSHRKLTCFNQGNAFRLVKAVRGYVQPAAIVPEPLEEIDRKGIPAIANASSEV